MKKKEILAILDILEKKNSHEPITIETVLYVLDETELTALKSIYATKFRQDIGITTDIINVAIRNAREEISFSQDLYIANACSNGDDFSATFNNVMMGEYYQTY